MGPANMPEPVVDRLHKELVAVVATESENHYTKTSASDIWRRMDTRHDQEREPHLTSAHPTARLASPIPLSFNRGPAFMY